MVFQTEHRRTAATDQEGILGPGGVGIRIVRHGAGILGLSLLPSSELAEHLANGSPANRAPLNVAVDVYILRQPEVLAQAPHALPQL